MKYEPVFKFPYSNVIITDLFVPSYKEFSPIVTIKNGKWEFFLSKDILKEIANKGFQMALEEGRYNKLEQKYTSFSEEIKEIQNKNVEGLSKEEFASFLEYMQAFAKKFLNVYRETEFFYFYKIEEELDQYIKSANHSFQDILSNKVEIVSWPEEKRKLADYIITMQSLKLKYRELMNSVIMGPQSIMARVLGQLVLKTGREDSLSMTIDEAKSCLLGEEVKNVSDRHLYSYIIWDEENQKLVISSGSDGYKKIRELEKQIPKNEVIGTVACKGIVRGKVKIIPFSMNPEKYLSKMEKGDILVSDTTGPELTPAIEKAAAIVTDEGGMMSHAAIIAREFQIPCVVGTKYATEVFKDGDLVEVNANNGLVRKVDE